MKTREYSREISPVSGCDVFMHFFSYTRAVALTWYTLAYWILYSANRHYACMHRLWPLMLHVCCMVFFDRKIIDYILLLFLLFNVIVDCRNYTVVCHAVDVYVYRVAPKLSFSFYFKTTLSIQTTMRMRVKSWPKFRYFWQYLQIRVIANKILSHVLDRSIRIFSTDEFCWKFEK